MRILSDFNNTGSLLDNEFRKVIFMEHQMDKKIRQVDKYCFRHLRFVYNKDFNIYKQWFYEDSFGAPVGRDDRGVCIYKIASIMKIPNHCFRKPEYSILLPPITRGVAKFAGSKVKSILLKKNVIERNIINHPEISNNKFVLDNAIYHSTLVIYNKPVLRSNYYVVVGLPNKHYAMATLDFSSTKCYIEVVDWRCVSLDVINGMIHKSQSNGRDFCLL